MKPADSQLVLPDGDLWVFGYGSLMWRPGFPYLDVRIGRIHGYHRALCIWSWVYRGTQAKPGLVLGLESGGSCVGRAFRVRAGDKQVATDYLYEREMITHVYAPRLMPALLDDGRRVTALTFVVNRTHAQYAGKLTAQEAAATVRRSSGSGGANAEYIARTAAHLDELGITDTLVHEVDALVNSD